MTLGCLQDVHWGDGSFGYFPSYAIGCLIAASAVGGDGARAGPACRGPGAGRGRPDQVGWLREHVHRHGRRLDTVPLIRAATGEELRIEPFLRYVTPFAARA